MSQDITTSRAGNRTVGAQTEPSDNIKRRLGAWTAPMAVQTASIRAKDSAAQGPAITSGRVRVMAKGGPPKKPSRSKEWDNTKGGRLTLTVD